MSRQVTLGGERLGAGKRNKVEMHGYERSNHNLGFVFRSTMAPGTLVPFLTEVALPGDTFDIDLNLDVLTHPTVGPLFGSYKAQLDVFQVPIRLYQGKLHMNMLNIGRDMSQIFLPQITVKGAPLDITKNYDNQQINPSCLLSYLGIRGVGIENTPANEAMREFNAIGILAYWDIYKNYYANKQEEVGVVIHKDPNAVSMTITSAQIVGGNPSPIALDVTGTPVYLTCKMDQDTRIEIYATGGVPAEVIIENILLYIEEYEAGGINTPKVVKAIEYFKDWQVSTANDVIIGTNVTTLGKVFRAYGGISYDGAPADIGDLEPQLVEFPLTNIDQMRVDILGYTGFTTPFKIDATANAPYGLILTKGTSNGKYSVQFGQEGLAVKTYNSDLFNNWISTEWIDGADGISEVTKVDTSSGAFTIDELNMKRKIYDMLNRIAVSGGSYDDWLEVTYDHDRIRSAENPMYIGGLMQEVIFQEVVSNSRSLDQPLGTLAGRGKLGSNRKGGSIVAKIDEPSYIIGIVSLTPRIDYSQGNKWDVNLKTMNDFHKPQLDQIGFQDLLTDQMAWWDTRVDGNGVPTFKSAGKQPAWINYMTNVNVVRGNFADEAQQMFMTLNRRYEPEGYTIKDLTTYIDPSKFNHIFADTRRDAQNFWVQIGVNNNARRKMSAKVIPNL